MKRNRLVSALVIAAASVPVVLETTSKAQTITPAGYSGGTYTQNFDTLPVRSPAPSNSLTGTVLFANTAGPIALTDPLLYSAGVTPPTALTGWGFSRASGTGTGVNFTWGNGGGNSGAAYSLGTNDSTERAFGALGSSTQAPRLGLLLTNNTTNTYTGFTLGFTTEQWRTSTTTLNVLAFGFQVGANSNDLFTGAQTAAIAFDAVGFSPVSPNNGPVNGDDAANKKVLAPTAYTGTGFSWGPGKTLSLTWTDTNDTGNDAALGLDDLSFTPLLLTYQPRNLTWTAGTNRNWNTTSANWTGDGTVYTEGAAGSSIIGDNVTFTSTGSGIVTIQPGGVRPSQFIVNSGTDYTFTGGPVEGTTALVKSGGGKLVLASPNTFSGGVQINGGTFEYSNDNQLGTGTLSATEFSTIRPTAAIVSSRAVSVSGAGATIDVGANNVSIGQLSVGTVGSGATTTFTKNGSGELRTTSVFTAFGSVFNINAGTLAIQNTGGTSSIGASFGNEFAGNILLDGHQTLQIAAADGEGRFIAGGGTITLKGPGRSTTNAYSATNTTSLSVVRGEVTLSNNVIVNPDNNPGFRVNLGATAGGGFTSNFIINSVISGNTDINFSDGASAGAGIVSIRTPLAHTGSTSVNFGANGVVRLETANALPAGTALIFGDGFNRSATGSLDLNGNNISVASLESIRLPNGTNAAQPTFIGGIVNGSGNAATVTITGNAVTTYAGGLGTVISSNVATPSTNIGLTLAASHTGHLTLTGSAGTVNYTGATQVLGGKLTLGLAYVSPTSAVSTANSAELAIAPSSDPAGQPRVALEVASLTVGGSSKVSVAPAVRAGGANDQATIVTSSLSVAPSAFVDLTNNDMVVRNGNLAAIRALVGTWYTADGGLPGTVGLGSSTAFYTPNGGFTTLAVYDNSAGTIGSFNGISVSPSDVLVKYTYLGDTDIDGDVDASDLARVLQGLNGLGSGWNFGDVNYDGVVNFFDLGRVQAALVGQGAVLGNASTPGAGGVIPEPSSMGLLALALPLLSRRRRA